MQLTQSEANLVRRVISHLRSWEYTNIKIMRRDGKTYVDNGYSMVYDVKYIGSVARGTEPTEPIDIVESIVDNTK